MNSIPKQHEINDVKNNYKKGDRVKLIKMNDAFAPLCGTLGTVVCVDDIGTIHVQWDNGSKLGVIYGEDQCAKI